MFSCWLYFWDSSAVICGLANVWPNWLEVPGLNVAARQLGELCTGDRTLFLVGAGLRHVQGTELAQCLSVGRAHLDVALERHDRLGVPVLALERGGEIAMT